MLICPQLFDPNYFLKRVLAGGGLNGDPAQFGELVDAGLAAKPAIAAAFHAAKWHLRFVVHGGAIDVANA